MIEPTITQNTYITQMMNFEKLITAGNTVKFTSAIAALKQRMEQHDKP